jgi:hypothetical protein
VHDFDGGDEPFRWVSSGSEQCIYAAEAFVRTNDVNLVST